MSETLEQCPGCYRLVTLIRWNGERILKVHKLELYGAGIRCAWSRMPPTAPSDPKRSE